VQLGPLAAAPLCLRLPRGRWSQNGEHLPCQLASGGGQWVQIAGPAGVAAVALQRHPEGPEGAQGPEGAVVHPVQLRLEPSAGAPERWSLSNGLITAELGPEGVRQVWGADGLPQLAAPLQWRRWRDHGEFWDAWDLAGNYRDHPLELDWLAGPTLVEQGPLCSRLVWRGRAGQSALRLDVQLRAGCPWLELSLSVDWRQQHELLRLELPLAQASSRYAADTSGGVLERPAQACTPREQARWEVPAISWIASQGQGGGLAVLLDGPQGVSAQPDQLGISLLRAPTWPDPSADNGYQRLRLALLPCPGGWRQAGVPHQAVRFREPVWLRPQQPGDRQVEPPQMALPSGLRLGNAALQLVGLRPDPEGETGVAVLTVQNLSPLRQVLEVPDPWWLLDGPPGGWLKPWQLLSLRIRRDRR
jgi:alpha-mannosidase